MSARTVINFRPGKLGERIEILLAVLRRRQPDVELSAVLRDGLDAFWPQISAYSITRQLAVLDQSKLEQLAVITGSCAKALEHGVTPAQLEEALQDLVANRLVTTPRD